MVKVKWSRYRPGVAQRVGRGIALLFHVRGTIWGWVVSSTPRPQFNSGRDPVPILREVGWAPGPVRTGGKSRPHRDSIPDLPARSLSLYRLIYPDIYIYIYIYICVCVCVCVCVWDIHIVKKRLWVGHIQSTLTKALSYVTFRVYLRTLTSGNYFSNITWYEILPLRVNLYIYLYHWKGCLLITDIHISVFVDNLFFTVLYIFWFERHCIIYSQTNSTGPRVDIIL